MKIILLKKGLIFFVICLFLSISIPLVVCGSSSYFQSNDDSLVDHLRIKVKTSFLDILLRADVFSIHIWNDNDCTIDFYLDINVTSRLMGRVIFDHGFGLIKDVTPGCYCDFGFFDYRDFKAKWYLYGIFDVNIKVSVVQDGSVKIHTAHGIIFGIAAIVWNFTLIK